MIRKLNRLTIMEQTSQQIAASMVLAINRAELVSKYKEIKNEIEKF